jgi:hypothetical protein
MSRRLQIVLPNPVATRLEELAAPGFYDLVGCRLQLERPGAVML